MVKIMRMRYALLAAFNFVFNLNDDLVFLLSLLTLLVYYPILALLVHCPLYHCNPIEIVVIWFVLSLQHTSPCTNVILITHSLIVCMQIVILLVFHNHHQLSNFFPFDIFRHEIFSTSFRLVTLPWVEIYMKCLVSFGTLGVHYFNTFVCVNFIITFKFCISLYLQFPWMKSSCLLV